MNGKTPRGGAIALPIPRKDDADRCKARSDDELEAFEEALDRIPIFKNMRVATIAAYGEIAWGAQLALLRLINEAEIRENRSHSR